jgi:hypothetical protein
MTGVPAISGTAYVSLAARTGLSLAQVTALARSQKLHLLFEPPNAQRRHGKRQLRTPAEIRDMLESGALDITERRTLSGHEARAQAIGRRYARDPMTGHQAIVELQRKQRPSDPMDPRQALLAAHRRRSLATDELAELHRQRYGETP